MNTYSFIGFAEPFSALSHMFGALICALCSISLVFSKERACGVRIALGVFCFSCVLLLSMSGLFHLLPRDNSASSLLQRLDHAAIFILIAGTFTPIHYVKFKGFWCWAPLCVVWSVAVSGIVLKSVFFTEIPESVSLLTYLSMGWFGILTAFLLWLESGFSLVRPLLSGAIAYSVGAVTEFLRLPVLIPGIIGPHELFHIAVLLGIAYHWRLVRQIVTVPNVAIRSIPDMKA